MFAISTGIGVDFALMPSDVAPAATALRAYSICTSFPLGLNVVREKEYCNVKHRHCISPITYDAGISESPHIRRHLLASPRVQQVQVPEAPQQHSQAPETRPSCKPVAMSACVGCGKVLHCLVLPRQAQSLPQSPMRQDADKCGVQTEHARGRQSGLFCYACSEEQWGGTG